MNIRIGPWRLTIEIVPVPKHKAIETITIPANAFSTPDMNGDCFPNLDKAILEYAANKKPVTFRHVPEEVE